MSRQGFTSCIGKGKGIYGRILYDDCTTKEDIEISQGAGNYRLFSGLHENANGCASDHGPRQNNIRHSTELNQVEWGDRVGVESMLSGRGFYNTRCMNGRTLDERREKLQKEANKMKGHNVYASECSKALNPDYTRLSHVPTYKYSEVGLHEKYHFEFPLDDPRGRVYYGEQNGSDPLNRFGENTHLQISDAYKMANPTFKTWE